MAIYKEIVTKAIIGKGKKDFKDIFVRRFDDVDAVLDGCRRNARF